METIVPSHFHCLFGCFVIRLHIYLKVAWLLVIFLTFFFLQALSPGKLLLELKNANSEIVGNQNDADCFNDWRLSRSITPYSWLSLSVFVFSDHMNLGQL